MNRRKFLKYAGTSAAVVGASALGLNYVSQHSPFMTIPTTSTTLVPRRTNTGISSSTSAEPVQVASLQGRLFFDYSGNGVQDGEEPAVAGALVQLKDNAGKIVAESLTDSSGGYTLEDVGTGSYRLHVEADKKFRYMCRSIEDLRAVTDDYEVISSPMWTESGEVDIGLMEGFLTLPFGSADLEKVEAIHGYDHDDREGHVRDYLGSTTGQYSGIPPFHGIMKRYVGTGDRHLGWDYDVPTGTPVVASAPGYAWREEGVNPQYPELGTWYQVCVDHSHFLAGNRFITCYGHIRSYCINDGQFVQRGQLIAYSGSTGTSVPHLHFFLKNMDSGKSVDPSRDMLDPAAVSYWTKDNDPQYAVT